MVSNALAMALGSVLRALQLMQLMALPERLAVPLAVVVQRQG
jgi:hypothetical protein